MRLKTMERIKLENGALSAVIDLSRGANCIALRDARYGAKILREPPEDGALDNPYLYGMPILFPVNRIEGGAFDFEGRRYELPINEPQTGCHLHGELHRTPFLPIEITESRLLCRFEATEDRPYLSFPHAFGIEMEYELSGGVFLHTVRVTNRSEQNMPLMLGFHTTFNTAFAGGRAEDIRVFADITEEYERNLAVNYLPTGKKPKFDEVSSALAEGNYAPFFAPTSRHYRGNGNMTIADTAQRLRLVYENDEKYTFRLIYNGGSEGYICLEPQNCLANCANSPFSREEAGFSYLRAGETKIFRSKIYIEEIKL